jgi:hypothetical protein
MRSDAAALQHPCRCRALLALGKVADIEVRLQKIHLDFTLSPFEDSNSLGTADKPRLTVVGSPRRDRAIKHASGILKIS